MTRHSVPSRRAALLLAGWPLAAAALDLRSLVAAGTPAHREIDVPAFSGLRIGGSLPVELVQRQPAKVLVDAEADRIGQLEARVDDGWLVLQHTGRGAPSRLRVVVQVWALERVDLSGSAVLSGAELVAKRLAVQASGSSVMRLDRLTAEVLSLQCNGSASLRVAGRANELELAMGGSAQLQAADFEVRRVGVKLGGSAGARLWAADALDGAIGGSAQLRYRGSPAVQVARGGSARVAPLE